MSVDAFAQHRLTSFFLYLFSVRSLPQVFYPSVTDIFERKNTPKLIYCLHATGYVSPNIIAALCFCHFFLSPSFLFPPTHLQCLRLFILLFLSLFVPAFFVVVTLFSVGQFDSNVAQFSLKGGRFACVLCN